MCVMFDFFQFLVASAIYARAISSFACAPCNNPLDCGSALTGNVALGMVPAATGTVRRNVRPTEGLSMRRRALRRSLVCLAAILLATTALGSFSVLRVPRNYSRMTVPAGQDRRKLSGEFMSGVNEMMETIRTNGDGRWQETFSADQMNSYFEEDFLRATPFRLPDRIHSPRVNIEPDRFTLAFQYGRGFWSTVVTIDTKIWVVAGERNVVAIEFDGLHAGAVPISLQTFLEQIAESARQLAIEVTWYRHGSNPVALLRFQADRENPTVVIQKLELQDGKLVIAGKSNEAAPLRTMLSMAGQHGQ